MALAEFVPEVAVGVRGAEVAGTEHAVMLAHDLAQRVTHRLQEVVVCVDDVAVQVEFDHRLHAVDGVESG